MRKFYKSYFIRPARLSWLLLAMLGGNSFIAGAHTAAAAYYQQAITGTIVSKADGMPLPGATVLVKGTQTATSTDENGNFSIAAPADAVLVVSFMGFTAQEIPVAGQSVINITLQEDVKQLEEVVVVGYGTQKKTTLTGAVSSIKGEEIIKAPVTNVSQSIAGRVPGVFATSQGGEPGYDGASLRIRGVNTFGDSSPLVVVDGVPGRSLDRIDPSTIESISVLKDASAAIYGAQAANGVILITTKRGKSGKPTVRLSHNQGIATPTTLPKMANAAQYATMLNEIDGYAGVQPRFTDEDIAMYGNGSDPWRYPNTNWFKETLKKWSEQTYTNLSIDGGSENTKYFLSISKKGQDGFYKNSATRYDEYALRSNLDIRVNDYVKLYANLSGRMEDRNFPTRSSQDIFTFLMRGKPNMPAYWPTGQPGPDIEFGNNPVVIATDATGYDRDKRYVLNSDFGAEFKIPGVQGLTLKANASVDKGFRFQKTWRTPWYLYTWDGTTLGADGNPLLVEGKKGFDDARLNESMEDTKNILTRGVIDYTRTFAESHAVNVLAGVERIEGDGDNFSAFRRYFQSTAIDQLFAGGQAEINNNGSAYKNARLNYFGRVNYTYKDKYLAEFVWRYQGSYIFEQGSRFGFFPGVSLGYVLSEEEFWKKNIPVVSFAKLRASVGQTGNDLISPYQYLASYTLGNLAYIDGQGGVRNQTLYEGVVPNTGVTWEKATQKDIGIDLQFFDGKLSFTADYFDNKRNDILWTRNASVPSTAGLTLPAENIGKFQNKGMDFSIGYNGKINDFRYGVNLNGTYAKNKVLFWDESPGAPSYQQTTGYPYGSALYYNAIGIFQNQAEIDNYPHWSGARPGDIIFEDLNNDGVIDGKDRTRTDKTNAPRFTGGLNLTASYKGFDLNVLMQGAAGGVFYQTTESGDFGNYLEDFYKNRWTADNPSASNPRTYNRTNEYWVSQRNTYWLRKTDYVRVKNIEFGYTLPSDFTQKFAIQNFRLYMSAFNLLTYAPDMKDFDPETPQGSNGSGYTYPQSKVINFGASITF
jgi:TonB-dependent starch-binding outer membrane protein SusC